MTNSKLPIIPESDESGDVDTIIKTQVEGMREKLRDDIRDIFDNLMAQRDQPPQFPPQDASSSTFPSGQTPPPPPSQDFSTTHGFTPPPWNSPRPQNLPLGYPPWSPNTNLPSSSTHSWPQNINQTSVHSQQWVPNTTQPHSNTSNYFPQNNTPWPPTYTQHTWPEQNTNQNGNQHYYPPRYKMELPKFNGTDFKSWAGSALAPVYITSIGGMANARWDTYLLELKKRFASKDFADFLFDLVRTWHIGTIQSYYNDFMALLNIAGIPESQALSIFLANLKDDILGQLRLHRPSTLQQAAEMSMLIESNLESTTKSSSYTKTTTTTQIQTIPATGYYRPPPPKSTLPPIITTPNPSKQSTITKTNTSPATHKKPTPAEIAERKKKGLCIWCQAKYSPGHKCYKSQLYSIGGQDGEDDSNLDFLVEELPEGAESNEFNSEVLESVEQPIISLHAIYGTSGYQTMRICCTIKHHSLIILIDSGSTHNFIDGNVVKKLGLKMNQRAQTEVTIADGTAVTTWGSCERLHWQVQGMHFSSTFMVLALKGCDMVLGIEWLVSLGPILWDFSMLTMQFMYDNNWKLLQGITPGHIRLSQSKQTLKFLNSMLVSQSQQPYTLMLAETTHSQLKLKPTAEIDATLQQFLEQYNILFEEPKGLPPSRPQDHRIPLKDESKTVKIRPYRHPSIHKDEIEKMIKEMLDSGVIRHSNSSFASPIVMIGIPTRAVLCQNGRPIAYFSKALGPKHVSLSVYEKEMLAVLMAVKKWNSYLSGRHFIIKTDHQSLKFLSNQQATTPAQQLWVTKMMGYDYEVQYGKGINNVVTYTLSRKPLATTAQLMAITSFNSELMGRIQASWETDTKLQQVILKLKQGQTSNSKYTWSGNQLHRKGKLVVGDDRELRRELLEYFHNSPLGGHAGMQATLSRITSVFYWKGLRKAVRHWVKDCITCQKHKTYNSAYPGLLQPLPVPETIWTDISMDFIEGLPKSRGKDVIFVVVDRLSKYAHLLLLSHTFTAIDIAQAFMDNIFKLHGMPATIVSDKDKIFFSTFWKELLRRQGVKLKTSTAYHPQTDGQTEVVNKCLESYLRCTSIVETIDRNLKAREAALSMMKFYLERAQNRMKLQADKRRSDREFKVGNWVYVKLQPYKQQSVAHRECLKLSAKYFGPYEILKRIGTVAYQLQLPESAKIHSTFHVSQLKMHNGDKPSALQLPLLNTEGTITKEPISIVDRRTVKRNNMVVTEVLVNRANTFLEDATWEVLSELQKHPTLLAWLPNPMGGIMVYLLMLRHSFFASSKTSTSYSFEVKNLGASLIDDLEDFAMGGMRNKASKYEEAEDVTKKTQQYRENDLESYFAVSSRSSSAPKSRATTSDPMFDVNIHNRQSASCRGIIHCKEDFFCCYGIWNR
ncbi:Integrase, catalytic core [Corchorus capsularis]|uniref:Integrase, catalytic core n=1 Tax=Corchorus capsularis TaxID=210143 RepID=A0A1R3IWP6_COCAP|nr:Integrase, catalytic core [Corchorus capsularis]